MNSHLNIFKSYSREDRGYQLENDLTRALAICLAEDSLLLHEILQFILKGKFDKLFADHSHDSNVMIDIQKNVSDLNGFSHLFAVSLSEFKMNTETFYNCEHNANYDPITDLVIIVNDITIIFEVKPNAIDCTSQLYNQAYNANDKIVSRDMVTPIDLNWKDLMELIIKISNFHKTTGKPSRYLNDFIDLIKNHNYRWLPQNPFSKLTFKNLNKAYERLDAGILNAQSTSVGYNDRHGFSVNFNWASEILFDCINDTINNKKFLRCYIWPGNTKGQGWSLFPKNGEPNFKKSVFLSGRNYEINKVFHLKFTHFQKYFTCLEGTEDDLLLPLVNAENFRSISGRKKKNLNQWNTLEFFFDNHFKPEYDWRGKCGWTKILESNRSYFDLAFGYCLSIDIPLDELQKIDTNRDDLLPLSNLLDEVKNEFEKIL